jgi:hypothetical protein
MNYLEISEIKIRELYGSGNNWGIPPNVQKKEESNSREVSSVVVEENDEVYFCVNICIYVYIYVYIYICVHICIYVYMNNYERT